MTRRDPSSARLRPHGIREVVASCAKVVDAATHVRIYADMVGRWAGGYRPDGISAHATPLDDVQGGREDIAHLILLVDSLNFCFWSADPIRGTWHGRKVERYMAFAARVAALVAEDRRWLQPAFWRDMTRTTFDAAFCMPGEWLMRDDRVGVLRETGEVITRRYGGSFVNMVEASGGSAVGLALLLSESLGSFRDFAWHAAAGIHAWLLKRAQICAIDLALAWASRGMGQLHDLDQLTAFADYRVPQILRHLGIISVGQEFGQRIASEIEIACASAEEVELRAASIVAVDMMSAALQREPAGVVPAWRIDFDLWSASHDSRVVMPHHRTRTVFY